MDSHVLVNAAGDAVEAIVVLPPGIAASANDVNVEVLGDDTLFVESVTGWKLALPLPFPVDPDTGRVKFRRATGRLTFTASGRTPPNPPRTRPADDAVPESARAPDLALGPPSTCLTSSSVTTSDSSCRAATEGGASACGTGTSARHSSVGDAEGDNCASGTSPCVGLSQAEPDPVPGVKEFSHSPAAAAAAAGDSSYEQGPAGTPTALPAARPPGVGTQPEDSHQTRAEAEMRAASSSPDAWVTGAQTGTGCSNGSVHPPHLADEVAGSVAVAQLQAAASQLVSASRTAFVAEPSAPRSPGGRGAGGDGGAVPQEPVCGSHDDVALYAEFYSDSPPTATGAARTVGTETAATSPPGPPAAAPVAATSPPTPTAGVATVAEAVRPSSSGAAPAAATAAAVAPGGGSNAARVSAAFVPTGGTASRDHGFSFTAPEPPAPPPLPPGLPPVAPPIDCRYLAVANGLRISGHAGTAALAGLMGLGLRRPSAKAERRKSEKVDSILQQVADTLDVYGYAVLDNYISEAAVQAARKELAVMEPHYSPGLIWVGKEAETGAQISVSSVRGDVVLWLDDGALAATAFVKDGVRRDCSFMQLQQLLADVDELVFEGLRPRLPYLSGLHRRSDAMMAVYPGKGARFAKHVDNTTGDGRRLTVLTYLNPAWKEQQGGALRLFPVRPGAAEQVDVLPVAGRVALFLSAEVAHEVMPAFALRHAVTLWYFDAGEHAAALTAAKVLPGASSRPSAQAAATALLRDLLADEASSEVQATPEGCAALGIRVAALEPGAKQLLAAVLGLPSATALVESMRNMTPDSLRRRREELRNMGLGTQSHAPITAGHN